MPSPEVERNEWLDEDADMESVTLTLRNSLPKLRQIRDKLGQNRRVEPTVVIEDEYDVRGDQ